MNFENWCNKEVSKSAKILLSKLIFYGKNHRNLSQFFFHWRIPIYAQIFCYWQFLITSFLKINLLLKWCPIFDSSPLHQFSKFRNFLWVCWFLGKNLSNFVSFAWKLDNPYYHTQDPKYLNFGSNSYNWSQIYRMNLTEYENPIPPSVTEYTLLSKKETFVLFGIMLGLQTFVVFLAKLLVSKSFRKLNFLEKVIHAFENTNLADPG